MQRHRTAAARASRAITVLAILAILALVLTTQAHAHAGERATFNLHAEPGKTVKKTVRVSRGFDGDRVLIKIGGRYAAVADWRGCALDSARARVLVTIYACRDDGRITVSAATTGRRRARVLVRLTDLPEKPRRDAPAPAPAPTPSPDDPDADVVPTATDNCPDDANADQADEDADGSGDACD